jgi:hypothetical protein
MTHTEQKYELSAKAHETLKRNEYLRKLECGLEHIPEIKHRIDAAIFDPERIIPERVEEEINGTMIVKFKFIYIIMDAFAAPWENALFKIIVDSKTSAKIDAYLNEGKNVLGIEILRTPKGIKYKISHDEDFHRSIPGYQIPLPKDLTRGWLCT